MPPRFIPTGLAALLALALAAPMAAPAGAQSFSPGREQDEARRAMLDGQVMPLSVIKRRVDRQMGDASFVGVAPSPRDGVYRLQYLRPDGVVIWVDVDGKSGDIIARTR